MNTRELNKRITSLSTRNAAVTAEIQLLGVECLKHAARVEAGGYGDVMPLNRLVLALNRPQTQAFVSWAMAFGMVARNMKKDTKAVMPLVYDKTRKLDLIGAAEKTWDMFAPTKEESIAKAYDLQADVMKVLKHAAAAGKPQSLLNALAAAAGIDAAKVPKSEADMPAADVALI